MSQLAAAQKSPHQMQNGQNSQHDRRDVPPLARLRCRERPTRRRATFPPPGAKAAGLTRFPIQNSPASRPFARQQSRPANVRSGRRWRSPEAGSPGWQNSGSGSRKEGPARQAMKPFQTPSPRPSRADAITIPCAPRVSDHHRSSSNLFVRLLRNRSRSRRRLAGKLSEKIIHHSAGAVERRLRASQKRRWAIRRNSGIVREGAPLLGQNRRLRLVDRDVLNLNGVDADLVEHGRFSGAKVGGHRIVGIRFHQCRSGDAGHGVRLHDRRPRRGRRDRHVTSRCSPRLQQQRD